MNEEIKQDVWGGNNCHEEGKGKWNEKDENEDGRKVERP